MTPTTSLDQLNTEQLRSLAAQLLQNIERLDKEVLHHKTRNQQLIHEIAQLKRHRFAKRAQSFSHDQASSLDELIDADIAAIEAEPEILAAKSASSPAGQNPGSLGPAAGTSRFPLCELKKYKPHTRSVLGSLCFEAQENLLCPWARDSRVDGCVACFVQGGGRGSQPDLSAIPGTFPFGYSTYSLPSVY